MSFRPKARRLFVMILIFICGYFASYYIKHDIDPASAAAGSSCKLPTSGTGSWYLRESNDGRGYVLDISGIPADCVTGPIEVDHAFYTQGRFFVSYRYK